MRADSTLQVGAPTRSHTQRGVATTTFAQHRAAVVNGMDYALLDADGKIAEVTMYWRPLPSAVEMQGHLAHVLGMQAWELRTNAE